MKANIFHEKGIRALKFFLLTIVASLFLFLFLYLNKSNQELLEDSQDKKVADIVLKDITNKAYRNNKLNWEFHAKLVRLYKNRNIDCENVRADVFLGNGDKVLIKGEKGTFSLASNDIKISGQVSFSYQDKRFKSQHIYYVSKKNILYSDYPVEVKGNDFESKSSDFFLDLNKRKLILNKLSGYVQEIQKEQKHISVAKIKITAEKIIIDYNKNLITCEGLVEIKEDKNFIRAEKIQIFYDKKSNIKEISNSIKRLIAYKKIEFLFNDVSMKGEQLEFLRDEQILILSGNDLSEAQFVKGKNRISAGKMIFNIKNKQVKILGDQSNNQKIKINVKPDELKKNIKK